MGKLKRSALLICIGAAIWSGAVTAQSIMDYMKQDGLIADDRPAGFKDAKSAAAAIAKDPAYTKFDSPLIEATGITQYVNKSQPWTMWWVFGPKSMAYPAVVRRRVVNLGTYAETRTSVLCDAAKTACDAMRQRFDAMDHVCGKSTPACKH